MTDEADAPMPEQSYDLIVAGSGAAGLATAIMAHAQGLSVIILEKTDLIGGTSCYSGGVSWVPTSLQNREANPRDTIDRSELYLDSTVFTAHEREARRVYLESAPEAFAYLESITKPLFYVRESNSPDYYPDVPGASREGRAMTPLTFDGRLLGDNFRHLRPPLPELSLFGRQMLELMDVFHLLNARRSWKSAMHTAGLLLRDLRDRIFYRKYRRGVRLTGGNALVANLYKVALDREIPILRNTPLVDLIVSEHRINGVLAQHKGKQLTILANRAVVLATGGFPWSKELRERYASAVPFGYSATSEVGTGDGISIAMAHGGRFDDRNVQPAFWSPVSIFKRKDGSTARFPHLMADRAKPGLIAVNRLGRRFCNEAENYHDFVQSMIADRSNEDEPFAHLICDSAFVRKYAFGAVPPLASERRRLKKAGYLIEAATIDELAAKIGVDARTLEQTLLHYNADASRGKDTEFGKGESAYNRYLGDPLHKPNPCLAPVDKAPFFAIKIYPGDIGTTSGLAANNHSQVLDGSGKPVEGLYACGNDRNSIMGGYYPSGGITIGPGLTFAYLAVRHILTASATRHQDDQASQPHIEPANGGPFPA